MPLLSTLGTVDWLPVGIVSWVGNSGVVSRSKWDFWSLELLGDAGGTGTPRGAGIPAAAENGVSGAVPRPAGRDVGAGQFSETHVPESVMTELH